MKHIIVLIACLLVAGCASVPKATLEYQKKAEAYAPSAGKAGVYVLRSCTCQDSRFLYHISLDYQNLGTLADRSYLYFEVEPGLHRLRAQIPLGTRRIDPYDLKAESGKLYYFETRPGFYRVCLKPLDETKAKEALKKSHLSGDSLFETRLQGAK
jgi:hypothetical protein